MELLERALADSRFAALSWDEILCAYFGGPFIGKKEQREREESDPNDFFAQYADPSGDIGARFLAEILSGECEGAQPAVRAIPGRPGIAWAAAARFDTCL